MCLAVLVAAGAVQADTITVGPDADTYISGDVAYGSAPHMYLAGAGNVVGYLRFDLSEYNVVSIDSATLTLKNATGAPRNDNAVVGRFILNGLQNVAGNTPQNWDEATLTAATVGAEWTANGGEPLVNVTVMDGETIINTPGANYWDDGARTFVVTGDLLVQFLQSRVEDNGLVTFILEFPGGDGRGYGIASKEHGTEDLRPVLELSATVGPKTSASKPTPSNGAEEVLTDARLSWRPGVSSVTNDLYLGASFDDVNAATRVDAKGVLVSQGQDANSYDPAGLLALGQTYYWRADGVGADGTIYRGGIWSFSTEPVGYPIRPILATASSQMKSTMGAGNTIGGKGLTGDQHSTTDDDMWISGAESQSPWIQYEFARLTKLYQMYVWNANQTTEGIVGFGAREVVVEVSEDGTTWTPVKGVPEFAQATGLPDYTYNTIVDLGGAAARFVRLTIKRNWSPLGLPQVGLSEVRFFEIPVRARSPKPLPGATGVAADAVLSWRPGRGATRHEVYFGTDPNALVLAQTLTESQVSLGSLGAGYGQTYYWRIDEVNEAAVPASWPGDTWSFSMPAYMAVDDFEAYNDQCNRIFFSWKDGLGYSDTPDCGVTAYSGNGTGSAVGNEGTPYAERSIMHSGQQAMPLFYNNTAGYTASEATRTFSAAQDWTLGGVKTLVLFFRGEATNGAGQLYVKINNTKVNYGGGADALSKTLWKQWNVDLTGLAGLQAVQSLTIGVSGSVQGKLYIDDIRLYREAPEVPVPVDPGTTGLEAWYTFEGDTKDSSANKRDATAVNDPTYTDSQTGLGRAILLDGVNDHVELPIGTLISTLTSTTVTTWVNFDPTLSGSWARIFDFGSGTTAYMFLTPRQATAGTMRFAILTTTITGESGMNAAATLPTGWHHVAVVIDGAGMTMQLYRDGEVVASGTITALPADIGQTTQNWLGQSQWSADGYFGGALDEFRIYSRPLSAGEVRYLAGDR